jgi:tetratricopeptide (TPR) repeat protein
MQTIKNRGGILLFVLLLAAALLSGCRPPGARALLKGKAFLERGRYPQAIDQLRAATALLPTNALAFNYLGLALHQAGQSAEAEKAYLRALALNHELVEVRYNLGCLFLSENKLDQAKAQLTAFTLRRVNSLEGWMKLGTAQLRNHEPGAAERSFSEVLRLRPSDPEALTAMGVARLERSGTAEAIQWFNKALKARRDYPPAVLNLAIVSHQYLKNKPLALQQYRYYLGLKPTHENAAAVQNIVLQLEQELAPAPALTTTPAATQNQLAKAPPPEPADAPVQHAASHAPTETPLQAVSNHLTRIERQIPEPKAHPTVETSKGSNAAPVLSNSNSQPMLAKAPPEPLPRQKVQSAASQPAPPLEEVNVPAEPTLKIARDEPRLSWESQPTSGNQVVSPTNSEITPLAEVKSQKHRLFQRLNPTRLFNGDEKVTPSMPLHQASSVSSTPPPPVQPVSNTTDAAILGFPRYTYSSPAKPEAGNRAEAERAFAQGVQAQKANHLPEAIAAYRRATQIDPSYYDAYYNLGLAAIESGNTQLALSTYEVALAIRPDALDARYNFALALKQGKFVPDAIVELQKLLAAYPNESRAHLVLGNLYAQQLHEPSKARAHYLKVLETDPRNPQAAAIRYWLTDNPS